VVSSTVEGIKGLKKVNSRIHSKRRKVFLLDCREETPWMNDPNHLLKREVW
jgi:hypothetical protein